VCVQCVYNVCVCVCAGPNDSNASVGGTFAQFRGGSGGFGVSCAVVCVCV